jgi:hypothetical protein
MVMHRPYGQVGSLRAKALAATTTEVMRTQYIGCTHVTCASSPALQTGYRLLYFSQLWTEPVQARALPTTL